jgi:hypothetical protein
MQSGRADGPAERVPRLVKVRTACVSARRADTEIVDFWVLIALARLLPSRNFSSANLFEFLEQRINRATAVEPGPHEPRGEMVMKADISSSWLRGRRGWLKHGNRVGDFTTAPRCGAKTRRGTACQCPALRGKRRCRLHGGLSTGPKTLDGLARNRAANTKHGRFSAEGQAAARWCRMYFRNGYRSLRALGSGTIRGMNGRAYFECLLAQEEINGIAPALVEAQRLEARAAVVDRDVQQLRAKGLLLVVAADERQRADNSREAQPDEP